jgi:hypothetical protein
MRRTTGQPPFVAEADLTCVSVDLGARGLCDDGHRRRQLGSPMVNASGEIVGLVFDNIHSIAGRTVRRRRTARSRIRLHPRRSRIYRSQGANRLLGIK